MNVRPIGKTGTPIHGGRVIDLDANAEVRAPLWVGTPTSMGIGRRMMRDAHVRRAVECITAPIVTADHDVDAASDDPQHQTHAEFIRRELFERRGDLFPDLLRKLFGYIIDGFSVVEYTTEVTEFRGKSMIGLSGFHDRPACTIDRWDADPLVSDHVRGVWQRTYGADHEPAGEVYIPRDRMIRACWDQSGSNFLGLAPLRSAHGPYKIKVFVSLLEAIRHERMGVAIPAINMPEGAGDADMEKAQDIAESMSSNERSHVVLPFGFKAEWLAGGQDTSMGAAIERANRDIAFNLGSGFQLLGLTDSSPGSHALASTQEGQLEILIELHAEYVYEVLNRGLDGFSLVRHLIDINFGPQEKYPKLVARNLPTRDWSALLPVVKDLTDKGLFRGDNTFRAFVRRVLKLPREDKNGTMVEPKAPEKPDPDMGD